MPVEVLTSLLAATATLVAIRARTMLRRDRRVLDELAGRLANLDRVCLSGLGKGLEAMQREDMSVRVAPETTPMQVDADGAVGQLVESFNGMLVRAQANLAAYNDVADRQAFIMERLGSVSAMLEALRANCLTDLTAALEAMGEQDLTRRVLPRTTPVPASQHDIAVIRELVETANGMLHRVQASVETYNRVADQQRDVIADMVDVASTLASSADQLAANASEVGRGTEEIADSTGLLASGTENQSRLLDVVARAAQGASDSAAAAHERSDDGATAVTRAGAGMQTLLATSHDVTKSVTSLADRSSRIGEIVDTITGIADQTNLLALNAAIEAARAGEQGRGFAVVADEVRKLAEESQHAAGTIGTILDEVRKDTDAAAKLVGASVEATESGVRLVDDARSLFEQIARGVHDVAASVDEISNAVDQASSVARSAAESTEQVAAATEQTTASMQEVAAASRDLAQLAVRVQAFTSGYRLDATQATIISMPRSA